MIVGGRVYRTLRRHLRALLDPPVPRDPPVRSPEAADRFKGLAQTLSSELFAHLLLELPAYRTELSGHYRSGDIEGLGTCTHKLRGAVVYCDAPELLQGLSDLQQALKTGNTQSIDACYARAINAIDKTLADSGQN
ncbi:MAG: hypothetical protein WBO57_06825 [Gammaproteobacteria bacterium]